MELGDGRNGRDALASQLRKLLTFRCVHIDKAIHVTYAEPLDAILRKLLPLGSKTEL